MTSITICILELRYIEVPNQQVERSSRLTLNKMTSLSNYKTYIRSSSEDGLANTLVTVTHNVFVKLTELLW